ncbi:MAG: hypothetical protein HW389_1323 [Bacteroidetes bacterium]|nr:hypothetical protein [Bacteroidota bacterium]
MTVRTPLIVLLFPFVVGPALHSQENPPPAADGQKHLHTSRMTSQTDTTMLGGLLAEVLSKNPKLQSSRTLARSAATRIHWRGVLCDSHNLAQSFERWNGDGLFCPTNDSVLWKKILDGKGGDSQNAYG